MRLSLLQTALLEVFRSKWVNDKTRSTLMLFKLPFLMTYTVSGDAQKVSAELLRLLVIGA